MPRTYDARFSHLSYGALCITPHAYGAWFGPQVPNFPTECLKARAALADPPFIRRVGHMPNFVQMCLKLWQCIRNKDNTQTDIFGFIYAYIHTYIHA